jgi:hypothetical protein
MSTLDSTYRGPKYERKGVRNLDCMQQNSRSEHSEHQNFEIFTKETKHRRTARSDICRGWLGSPSSSRCTRRCPSPPSLPPRRVRAPSGTVPSWLLVKINRELRGGLARRGRIRHHAQHGRALGWGGATISNSAAARAHGQEQRERCLTCAVRLRFNRCNACVLRAHARSGSAIRARTLYDMVAQV